MAGTIGVRVPLQNLNWGPVNSTVPFENTQSTSNHSNTANHSTHILTQIEYLAIAGTGYFMSPCDARTSYITQFKNNLILYMKWNHKPSMLWYIKYKSVIHLRGYVAWINKLNHSTKCVYIDDAINRFNFMILCLSRSISALRPQHQPMPR